MSDNITIKKLLDLDEGIFTKMSDITLEATVKEARQVYERKVKDGPRKGQPFWSQKLVINDGTGSIIVDYIANKVEETIPGTAVGKKIRIEKAKTDIYKDERRLAKGKGGKISLLESAKQPAKDNNGYETLIDGRTVVSREVWERKDRLITKTAVTKSLIEAGRKWSKAVEKEADGWLGWIYNSKPEPSIIEVSEDSIMGKKIADSGREIKPEEKSEPARKKPDSVIDGSTVSFSRIADKDFDRDKLIKRLGKKFAELFVSGKTKGLGLGEWLTKNYQVESFMALSDDYLVEIDSVFDDMEGDDKQ